MCTGDIFLGLLAILFPPIAVWIKSGICTADSLINILLCTLGYLPGLIHAWYIISLYPEPSEYEYETIHDPEPGERVSYYYVDRQPGGANIVRQNDPNLQAGYGTVDPMRAPPPQQQQQQDAGEGSAEGGVPPSYEQAIRGDHKVQT